MTKDELIDKYRDFNTDHDWWDSTYGCFKEQMRAIGIDVDRIYFSGFWSQGDGACFEGSVSDWRLFLKSIGEDSNPVLVEFIREHWSFRVEHSGHYYHENCTFFHAEMPNPDGEYDKWFIEPNPDGEYDKWFIERYSPYGEDDFRSVSWLAVLRSVDFDLLETTFCEAFKDHMRQLYKDLEAEYDYLTSDEAVWESLEANDMTDELEGS